MRKSYFLLGMVAVLAGALSGHADQKAFSVPVSGRAVQLEVQVPEGRWIKAVVQEGDQLRIQDHDLNLIMAFIPVIQDGGIRIRAFRVEARPDGNETIHFVENVDTLRGDTSYTKKAKGSFAFKVLQVMDASEARSTENMSAKGSCKASENSTSDKAIAGGRCCVRCGGTTTCGCAVDDECGSCCSGVCCPYY